MKLIVVVVLFCLFIGFLIGLANGMAGDWWERKVYNKQKAEYLKAHPLHSGTEPIVWTCECGHADNKHTKYGCQPACFCKLSSREVRDRY